MCLTSELIKSRTAIFSAKTSLTDCITILTSVYFLAFALHLCLSLFLCLLSLLFCLFHLFHLRIHSLCNYTIRYLLIIYRRIILCTFDIHLSLNLQFCLELRVFEHRYQFLLSVDRRRPTKQVHLCL